MERYNRQALNISRRLMVDMEKFIFQNKEIKIEIFEDVVGWYLIAYRYPFEQPFCDYLQDTREDVFDEAYEKFEIHYSLFKKTV